MSSALKQLAGICAMFCTATLTTANGVVDGDALVQTHHSLGSSSEVRSQITTATMLSEAMGVRLLGKFMSHPHWHHKKAEAEKPAPVHPGCTETDFKAVEKHVQDLNASYTLRVQDALKANDTAAVGDLVQEMMPSECSFKDIFTVVGIKWLKLEACITAATQASPNCVQCPVQFLQKVVGKSVFEMPFSCAAKCGPMAAAGFKCGDESNECDAEVFAKASPCMTCLSPKLSELGHCAGLQYAQQMEQKLNDLLAVLGQGKEQIDSLLKKEADAEREELQPLVQNGTMLAKILGLAFNAVMD